MFLVGTGIYFVLPLRFFVVLALACAISFYAHVFFDKEYHVKGSWLRRFAWFRRKQELHFVHHRHANKNFAVIHFFWDNILGTYPAPESGASTSAKLANERAFDGNRESPKWRKDGGREHKSLKAGSAAQKAGARFTGPLSRIRHHNTKPLLFQTVKQQEYALTRDDCVLALMTQYETWTGDWAFAMRMHRLGMCRD